MTLTNPGGDGSGPDWLGPLIIVLVILSPFVVGLALRAFDRMANPPTFSVAFLQKSRKGVSIRFVLVVGTALIVAFVLAWAGSKFGPPLALVCVLAYLVRYGYPERRL